MLYNDIIITGNRAIAKSYAKINLSLDVLGRLENGYHEVEMVMQSLSLFDLVIVDKARYGIRLSTNCKFLPNDEKNIAYNFIRWHCLSRMASAGKRGYCARNFG